jgi:hypothetical protein
MIPLPSPHPDSLLIFGQIVKQAETRRLLIEQNINKKGDLPSLQKKIQLFIYGKILGL